LVFCLVLLALMISSLLSFNPQLSTINYFPRRIA